MSTRRIARLKRELKALGITHDAVAANVRPRPVSRTHVVHVLACRFTSSRVVRSAEELIARAEAQNGAAGLKTPPVTGRVLTAGVGS